MRIRIDSKIFGNKVVLKNLSLNMERGRHYAISGPSGCGKTTLLRIITGLDKDYIGDITEPFLSPIIVFQEDRLVEELSVKSNLKAVKNDEARIYYLLDKAGLKGEANSKISTLSGGMKRRVAIVRALLADSDSLFLDEPFNGLDDKTRDEIASLILSEIGDKTLVIISHDRSDDEIFHAIPISLSVISD